MKFKQIVLSGLGGYYIITGLWGLLSLESFMRIVWGRTFELHSQFLMHELSLLFVVLGASYLILRDCQLTYLYGGLIAISLAVMEIIYWNHVKTGLLMYDIFFEGILGGILLLSYGESKSKY